MSNEASGLSDKSVTSPTSAVENGATSPKTPVPPADAGAEDLALQLRPEQQAALRHLISGLSIKDAAGAAGVGRRTLFRWLRDDAAFAALFNLWKHEQMESARAQALALAGSAMKTIGNAIDKGHVSAALQVARGLGVLKPSAPGDTDPELLSRKRNIAAARQRARLDKAEQSYSVKRFRKIDSVAQCEEHLKFWGSWRDEFLLRDMNAWMRYDKVIRMSDDQRQREDIVKPANPPSCPRPTAEALRDMLRRDEDDKVLARDIERYLAGCGEPIPEWLSRVTGNDGASTEIASGAQPEASLPSAPGGSGSSAPPAVKSATAPTATVQTHATRVPAARTKIARKAPEPYLEPDEDGMWVRYS